MQQSWLLRARGHRADRPGRPDVKDASDSARSSCCAMSLHYEARAGRAAWWMPGCRGVTTIVRRVSQCTAAWSAAPRSWVANESVDALCVWCRWVAAAVRRVPLRIVLHDQHPGCQSRGSDRSMSHSKRLKCRVVGRECVSVCDTGCAAVSHIVDAGCGSECMVGACGAPRSR